MTFRPLAGLLVVEIGHDVSAAFGARLLADLGAEVVKIEPPLHGDPIRREGPLAAAGAQSASAFFAYLNHGKRSVSVDVTNAEGADLVHKLLARSDVFICAPGSAGAMPLELDFDSLDPLTRPVLVTVSPHGLAGARAGQPSSAFVVQHAAGFAFHQASPVADPNATPPTVGADSEGALAIGIVLANAALWALDSVEPGQPRPVVDLSAEDVYTYLLVEPFADWHAGIPTRNRQRDPAKATMIAGGLVWLLRCADGAVMVSPREDHQWARWIEVMDRPPWTSDAALCGDRVIRTRNATAIGRRMAEWSTAQMCQDVFAKAQAQRVACFPVSTPRDMVNNAQLADRNFYSKLHVAPDVVVPAPGLPFQIRTTGGRTLERGHEVTAPELGEGNADIFSARLGVMGERVEQLKERGVI
jgi:crotonobetainyl-CoA:carnitine CoA-transferase CaiB-like acyl-CoA transferase